MSNAAPAAEAAPAKDETTKPVRDGQWTKHVKKNIPANWKGTEKQYLALYHGQVDGLQSEAEKALAKLFGDAARVAQIKKDDLETPSVEIIFKIKLDFSDPEVAQFNGTAGFDEKTKHDASLGYVQELNPKGAGKQTDMITNPPTDSSPKLEGVAAGSKAAPDKAPQNKAATGGARKRAATPPASPSVTAEPGKK